jgi:hypothetical protein
MAALGRIRRRRRRRSDARAYLGWIWRRPGREEEEETLGSVPDEEGERRRR